MKQNLKMLVACACCLLGGCNCDQVAKSIGKSFAQAINAEMRAIYFEHIGPIILTSSIGTGASPFLPSSLSILTTDKMWQFYSENQHITQKDQRIDPPEDKESNSEPYGAPSIFFDEYLPPVNRLKTSPVNEE
jgi:hypothetical protein